MKFLDKVGLVAFATLILLEGLALILAISGWLELELIVQAVENIITGELASRITLVVSIVFWFKKYKQWQRRNIIRKWQW